jgi:hypothetical protein
LSSISTSFEMTEPLFWVAMSFVAVVVAWELRFVVGDGAEMG